MRVQYLFPLVSVGFLTGLRFLVGSLSPASAKKMPLYVVLRMDDTILGFFSDVQKSVLEWALSNNVKINFGISSGPDSNDQAWPTTCRESPLDKGCDDDIVSTMYKAYADGQVRGLNATKSALIEIFDHSWDHDAWGSMSSQERAEDLTKSMHALRAAYPNASVRTFVPPKNVATQETATHLRKHGLDILSSAGTMGCVSSWAGVPNRYNYMYAPCQPSDGGTASDWFCIPPNDTYITSGGFQKLSEGIFSAPTSSANTLFHDVTQGLEAKVVVGDSSSCGCVDAACSIIGAALNNAKKSNGVLWTVLMMHPQTKFPNQSYIDWLSSMLETVRSLEEYDVSFVHFQDLVSLQAPSDTMVLV